MIDAAHRLRKHAEYQRVYRASRKQFTRNIAYFSALRPTPPELAWPGAGDGPRIGLTVPKALGNAVVRNRIKRRVREAVRHALPLLKAPVDVVLHPRRIVLDLEFAQLEREVAKLFTSVQNACDRPAANQPRGEVEGAAKNGASNAAAARIRVEVEATAKAASGDARS